MLRGRLELLDGDTERDDAPSGLAEDKCAFLQLAAHRVDCRNWRHDLKSSHRVNQTNSSQTCALFKALCN